MSIEKLNQGRFYQSVKSLKRETKQGINDAFQALGERLVKTSRELIDDTKRAPWFYYVKIRGRYVRHYPSLPLQPAAEMTGKLKRSIRFVNRGRELVFGAGNTLNHSDSRSVNYAKYVENGTSKMVKRPYLKPSIKKNKSDAYRDFKYYLQRAVDK